MLMHFKRGREEIRLSVLFYFLNLFWVNVLTVVLIARLLLSFGSQPDDR